VISILTVSDREDVRGDEPPTSRRSEMSSSDETTISVHRALHEALNSAREALHLAEGGDATPDQDDLAQLGTLVASLSETATAVSSAMTAKAAHG
jgi:hypothetical protein